MVLRVIAGLKQSVTVIWLGNSIMSRIRKARNNKSDKCRLFWIKMDRGHAPVKPYFGSRRYTYGTYESHEGRFGSIKTVRTKGRRWQRKVVVQCEEKCGHPRSDNFMPIPTKIDSRCTEHMNWLEANSNKRKNWPELYVRCIEQNYEKISILPPSPTVWHSARKPNISLHDYVVRLLDTLQFDYPVLIISLVYLKRFKKQIRFDSHITMDTFSIHRLVLVSMVLAMKWHLDHSFSHSYICNAGGVSGIEMSTLMLSFLKILKYNCFIGHKLYMQALSDIQLEYEVVDLSKISIWNNWENSQEEMQEANGNSFDTF